MKDVEMSIYKKKYKKKFIKIQNNFRNNQIKGFNKYFYSF